MLLLGGLLRLPVLLLHALDGHQPLEVVLKSLFAGQHGHEVDRRRRVGIEVNNVLLHLVFIEDLLGFRSLLFLLFFLCLLFFFLLGLAVLRPLCRGGPSVEVGKWNAKMLRLLGLDFNLRFRFFGRYYS